MGLKGNEVYALVSKKGFIVKEKGFAIISQNKNDLEHIIFSTSNTLTPKNIKEKGFTIKKINIQVTSKGE